MQSLQKSCSKLLIRKTFWKRVSLPSVLHGTSIMSLTKVENIEKLQKIENGVCSQIVGAPYYAQVTALRGGVGVSTIEARIMEGRMKYMQYVMICSITEEMLARKDRWIQDKKKIYGRGHHPVKGDEGNHKRRYKRESDTMGYKKNGEVK